MPKKFDPAKKERAPRMIAEQASELATFPRVRVRTVS